MTEIIIAIIGVVTGNLTMFLFFPQMRKSKIIENDARQSEEWKKLYDETHAEVKEKEAQINELYQDITTHRNEKAELRVQVAELQVENAKLKLLKCELPKCPNRKPPTGY
jgi:septal ring factor EnvC (AmiA/AmiB activator)